MRNLLFILLLSLVSSCSTPPTLDEAADAEPPLSPAAVARLVQLPANQKWCWFQSMDAGASCFLRAAGGQWKRGVEQSMADHGATLGLTNASHTLQATVVSIDGGVFSYILAYKLGAEPAALRAWLMGAAEPGKTEAEGQEVWDDRANNAQITRIRQPGGVQFAYRVA